ncbi:MAG: hypothetical protein QXZ70_00945 [Candidatus Bathyarchaeia archaeon]
MSNEILAKDERLIVEALRKLGSCGFNELCYALSDRVSRPTIYKKLPRLVELGIVRREKWKRRGQKDQYVLTEVLDRFEEEARKLTLMWDDHDQQIKQLEALVNEGKLEHKEAGEMLVWLIFEAVPLFPMVLVNLPSTSLELDKRLLSFSAYRFRSFWEEILRLGHSHSKIREGLQKGCKDLRRYVKPITVMIEEALES